MTDGPWTKYASPSDAEVDPSALDAGPWTRYTASPELNAADIGKGAGMGLAHGVMGLAGLPGDISSSIDYGTSWMLGKAAEKLGLLPDIPTADGGKRPGTVEDLMKAGEQMPLPSGGLPADVSIPFPGATTIQKGVEKLTGPLNPYEPTTPEGQTAERLASFLPGAVAGPGNAVRNAVAYGAVPAAVSEAGRAVGGVPGAVAGAIGGSFLGHGVAGTSPADTILTNRVKGVSDATLKAAEDLQKRAAGIGINLTGAEALAQASGGQGNLPGLMRVLEGSPKTSPLTQNFFSQRPDQVKNAANSFFDQVAPAGSQPSALGSQAQEAAQGVLQSIKDKINAAASPFYEAAGKHLLSSDDFAPIAADPSFQVSLARLRADKDLGPRFEKYPDNSVAVINEVTKDMYARGTALSNASNPGFQPYASKVVGTGAGAARDIARTPALGGTSDYDTALTIEQEGRNRFLNPREAGPIGDISRTPSSEAQTRALYPSRPPPGSQLETAQAISDLEGQHPGLPAKLTRQHLEQQFAEGNQQNIPGDNQWGGAKFIAQTMGNPIQRQTLEAGLAALPNKPDIQTLAEALQATGTRHPIGSQTSFNDATLQQELAKGRAIPGMAATALSPGAWLTKAKDVYDRWNIGSNQKALAEALMSPDFFDKLRAARAASPGLVQQLLSVAGRAGLTPPVGPAAAQHLAEQAGQ